MLGFIFFWNNNFQMVIVITCLVVLLFGFFLVSGTQLIAAKVKHVMSIDNYIVGALILDLDIITIFIELLKVFGRERA